MCRAFFIGGSATQQSRLQAAQSRAGVSAHPAAEKGVVAVLVRMCELFPKVSKGFS